MPPEQDGEQRQGKQRRKREGIIPLSAVACGHKPWDVHGGCHRRNRDTVVAEVPAKDTVLGEMLQVELAGAPLQVNMTV
jgi:hypothetical protein